MSLIHLEKRKPQKGIQGVQTANYKHISIGVIFRNDYFLDDPLWKQDGKWMIFTFWIIEIKIEIKKWKKYEIYRKLSGVKQFILDNIK